MWKQIPGYENCYEASESGEIRSVDRIIPYPRDENYKSFLTGRLMSQCDCDGYLIVHLSNNGVKKNHTVHRLIALTFIPNPENKRTINHINGIKTDNRVENLEWASYKENINHAIKTGLRDLKGEKNNKAVLSASDILNIRLNKNGITKTEMAKLYGVKPACISKITLHRTWKHI